MMKYRNLIYTWVIYRYKKHLELVKSFICECKTNILDILVWNKSNRERELLTEEVNILKSNLKVKDNEVVKTMENIRKTEVKVLKNKE